jgi:hypothetical protein
VSERVAMTIRGQKTLAVFDRYDIVSPADLRAAARTLDGDIHGDSRPLALDGASVSR